MFSGGRGDALSGYKPLKLLLGHFHDLLLCPEPLASTVQKALLEQKKTISFPDETLYLIWLSATEHEQDILLKWVNIQLTANYRTQAVGTLGKIRIAVGNIDPLEAGSIV